MSRIKVLDQNKRNSKVFRQALEQRCKRLKSSRRRSDTDDGERVSMFDACSRRLPVMDFALRGRF